MSKLQDMQMQRDSRGLRVSTPDAGLDELLRAAVQRITADARQHHLPAAETGVLVRALLAAGRPDLARATALQTAAALPEHDAAALLATLVSWTGESALLRDAEDTRQRTSTLAAAPTPENVVRTLGAMRDAAADTASAARIVDEFVAFIIGPEPDATRNRYVLNPAIPREWQHFSASGLVFGDAEITLEYENAAGVVSIRTTQTAGPFPIRLILQPLLPDAPLGAFVDGEPATLAHTRARARWRVPVQIVLDAPRLLTLRIR